MIALLARIALSAGVPQRFAKAAGIAALMFAVIALLSIGKCTYDRSLIGKHDAQQSIDALADDADAKEKADVERRADDHRISETQKGLNDAIDQAPVTAPDPARVALNCERLRRQGRRSADLPGACRP